MGRYEPASGGFELLAGKAGKKSEEMGEIWLVSENLVDVTGARVVGCRERGWIEKKVALGGRMD